MGLLSYISHLKDPTRLEEELDWYNNQESRQIYLWQSEETDNLIGVVGVEEEEDIVLLRHIAVDPSFRNEGLTYKMLDGLKEIYDGKSIASTLETATFISKWQKKRAKKE